MEEPSVSVQEERGGETCQVTQLGSSFGQRGGMTIDTSEDQSFMKMPVVAGGCKLNSPAVAGVVEVTPSVKSDVDLAGSLASDAPQESNLPVETCQRYVLVIRC